MNVHGQLHPRSMDKNTLESKLFTPAIFYAPNV